MQNTRLLTHIEGETPVGAGVRGATAGLVATLLLSVLARVLPGMRPTLPFLPSMPDRPVVPGIVPVLAGTPAAALMQPAAPGPEGLAEQFAFKVASGVFDRDISAYLRPAGLMVHLAYGSAWGALYGLLQVSSPRAPEIAGTSYGILAWLVGPATLVPAMKLMGWPSQEPLLRTTTMLAAHVAYGLAAARAFEALDPKAR